MGRTNVASHTTSALWHGCKQAVASHDSTHITQGASLAMHTQQRQVWADSLHRVALEAQHLGHRTQGQPQYTYSSAS